MTLEKILRQQLSKPKPGGIQASFGGWNLTLVAERCDSLSCAIKELTLQRTTPIQEEFTPWAKRIAAQATGLMEPLRLIETDVLLNTAILRSSTPTLREDVATYYELVLVRGEQPGAKFQRYSASLKNGKQREVIPFALTHDAIIKFVMDIVGGN